MKASQSLRLDLLNRALLIYNRLAMSIFSWQKKDQIFG